ncbi:hypothetical protein EJ04DRAFT_516021 [Polyplosphaeria fusca]|uniref:Rhodopsin domain-containing protein n=1 Tax=Polyplosphaeria fusca TaxID=682080 RepID=A0A9P4QR18_9PLEO|nr:hypothetical protein EJ04DRAFT_516021 [Polyplosphaeria fusca]
MAGHSARRANISPPAAGNTPFDHSGWIVIANALGMILALIALAVRMYIRKSISPPCKSDDVFAWVATGVAFVQTSLVFWQIDVGFGRTIHDLAVFNVEKVQRIRYANDVLYLLIIYLTKCSMIFLLHRITPDAKQQQFLAVGLGGCALFALVSVVLSLTRCDTSSPWIQYGADCGALFAKWRAVAAFDVFSEIVVFSIPLTFLFGLQMKLDQKLKVVMAFALRLPVVVFALFRLYSLQKEIDSDDPTLAGALVYVWQQSEMHYSLIAATLPCVTPFLSSVNTHFGALELQSIAGSHAHSSPSTSRKRSNAGLMNPAEGVDEGESEAELVRDTAGEDVIQPVRKSPLMRRRSANRGLATEA